METKVRKGTWERNDIIRKLQANKNISNPEEECDYSSSDKSGKLDMSYSLSM